MIGRYEHPKIKEIFNSKSRVANFIDIEREASAYYGVDIPNIDLEKLLTDLREIEKSTKHETVAFLKALTNQAPSLKYLHHGLTSSDILDTCLSMQMKKACSVLQELVSGLISELKHFSFKHQRTKMVGRSHGKVGEIITLGFSFLSYLEEWERNLNRVVLAEEEISYGMLSGPMGNYSHTTKDRESHVCGRLGLIPERVSTQVIPRDRHAFLISTLGILGASLERLSTHIRNLGQSGIEEVSESFTRGQKGSSAMPHKRNPILSENVTGLARLLKGYVSPSLDNVSLWFERDMSHSSVERVIVEDSFHLACFGVERMTKVISTLTVSEENLSRNIEREGDRVYTHAVLCHLVSKGLDRHEAHNFVQDSSEDLFGQLALKYPEYYISSDKLEEEICSNMDSIFESFKPSKKGA